MGQGEFGAGASGVDHDDARRRERVARQVDDARIATLFELTPTPLIAGLAFAALVAFILWPYRPAAVVGGWVLLKFTIGALRMADVIRFNHGPRDPDAMRRWRQRAVLLLGLDGACWGAMGVAVILASLVGVAGSGVFSFISIARGCILLVSAVLLPSVVYQLQRGTDAGLFAALGLLIYLALMCLEARRGEARIVELLRLRFENALIAEERHRAMLLAEHSSAAKSRFLATVSHEVRTPLNGIMGMTQLLQRSAMGAEQRAQLETIRLSSEHLQTVIGDLLDLSRIEFGKLALEDLPLPLAATVREVTDLLHAVAVDKGLLFSVDVGGGAPGWVHGDASRIKQVLHNLIGNAIKFTARGAVAVHVAADGDRLAFRVSDTGVGVPPELLPRLFDAFEQGPSALGHARSGTGLGLTISRQLAQAMGGEVACSASGAQGSTFVFTLPLRVACAPASAVSAPESADLPATFEGHVLVVDDNPVNALVASTMLQRLGLTTDVADDGEAALRLMDSRGYDLVLMDCQLPVLDGWEATRRWRRGESGTRRLPIVALTANAVVGDRERCLQAGMDDYIAKPFRMEELTAVVTRNLGMALQRTG